MSVWCVGAGKRGWEGAQWRQGPLASAQSDRAAESCPVTTYQEHRACPSEPGAWGAVQTAAGTGQEPATPL